MIPQMIPHYSPNHWDDSPEKSLCLGYVEQGSLNGTHFFGGNQTRQIDGDFEEFP